MIPISFEFGAVHSQYAESARRVFEMKDSMYQLIELVAANGYEVKLATSSGVSVINIFHRPTNRESVFGFHALSSRDVFQFIAEQYCTEQQVMLLRGILERGDWVEGLAQ